MLIVKVPGINGLGKTDGCRNAGNVVLQELKDIWSSEKGRPVDIRLLDLEEIHVDNSNIEETCKLIYKNAYEMFKVKNKLVFLGGDHSISFPLFKAFNDANKEKREEKSLIVFDAHADCMPAGKEPSHEEWLRKLIESGFKTENIILVGVRNLHLEELRFLKSNRVKIIDMNRINDDIHDVADLLMEFSQGKELYLSIDIDVVDPGFACSVAYPEPGGLTSRQLIYLVQRLGLLKNLKAVDIVEIDVSKDIKARNMTAKLAARILAELL